MKTSVVTTTINIPTFIRAYADNVEYFGNKEVDFIVIGDMKSPAGIADFCKTIKNCRYFDPIDQMDYMRRFPELDKHLGWNTIARRNVGHLIAYEEGAESIIMLDDDNLATGANFVADHGIVGKDVVLPVVESSTGWFNVCSLLVEKHGVKFYARGYPPAQRWNDGLLTYGTKQTPVAVNAGLWVNDPDIDALTRLERRLITTAMHPSAPSTIGLKKGTWSPWNCQNTAISRWALPSYFLSPHTGRHLDIWASYITTKVAEHMGETIAFGNPIANHERQAHNLYKDLEQELPWIQKTDHFCDVLRNSEIKGNTYKESFASLIKALEQNWDTNHIVKPQYLEGLIVWYDTFDRLRA